jgi:hypothetical protein
VLRRTFGPKGEEVTEIWGKMHSEERHCMYSSSNITRVIKQRRWDEHVARTIEIRNTFSILVGKFVSLTLDGF